MSSASVEWLVENRVLYVRVTGSYDLNVANQTVPQVKAMFDAVTEPIHVVCDMTDVTAIPKNIREPIHRLQVLRDHKNLDWMIFVTHNHALGFAGQIGARLIGLKYRAVNSMDEALNTLLTIEPTLKSLIANRNAA